MKVGKISVPVVFDATNYLPNFTSAGGALLNALRSDVRYPYYNELFQATARVAEETGMLHTLELKWEPREEWNPGQDMVFVSCMLEDKS